MSGSIRPPFPSAPSDPALRRLGVGAAAGHARPLRAQLIVIIVLSLMLLAVPLYLWRRPAITAKISVTPSSALSASAGPVAAPIILPPIPDAGTLDTERVKLSSVRKVRCGATAKQSSDTENCDSLAYFEKALIDAVKGSADCAPRSGKPGSINFVLEVDFTHKKLHVFPGASGDWRGPKARRTTKCVMKALPSPDWETIAHQHRYYAMALLATFPANASDGSTGAR